MDWQACIQRDLEALGLDWDVGPEDAEVAILPTFTPAVVFRLMGPLVRVRLRRDDIWMGWCTGRWPVTVVETGRPMVMEDVEVGDTSGWMRRIDALELPPIEMGRDGTFIRARHAGRTHLCWSHPETELHAIAREVCDAVLARVRGRFVAEAVREGGRG